ncbi:MAG: flagellar type III secretion system pore protein FliP [Planctomycetota bacterium]|nr:flagellar type III secretion system pore protein FliP [Planctomycetota bacterium]
MRRGLSMIGLLAVLLLTPRALFAQASPQSPTEPAILVENPIGAVEQAARELGVEGGLSTSLNIIVLLTVLAIVPSVFILCTCFTRIVIVMSLLRQALGTQGLPPSQIIVGLSLFLTLVVMSPTFARMYDAGIRPYLTETSEQQSLPANQIEAWDRAKVPLREFMFDQIDHTGNWETVWMIEGFRRDARSQELDPEAMTTDEIDLLTLVPAYILSELKTAFLLGFKIYLPFLVIDMVIASLLISMGMMMLPPVLISLPFKLLLFVLVDGWDLVTFQLMSGVAPGAVG